MTKETKDLKIEFVITLLIGILGFVDIVTSTFAYQKWQISSAGIITAPIILLSTFIFGQKIAFIYILFSSIIRLWWIWLLVAFFIKRKINKTEEENLNASKKIEEETTATVKCKSCEKEFKKQYLLSSGLCSECDKLLHLTDNQKLT